MPSLEQQFAALYERYHLFVLRYIRKHINNMEDAEDMAQETFTRAWSAFAGTNKGDEVRLKAWLFVIATNIVRDHFRKHRKVAFVDIASFEHELYAPDTFDAVFDRDEIRQLLTNIKSHRRVTFYLRAYDFPFSEIAEMFSAKAPSVKTNYGRDLQKLATLVS